MSIISDMMLHDQELSNNKSKRILICLCVDSSASMLRGGAMQQVNSGIETFFEKTDHSTLARDAADICIVSFGDKARVVCDFGPLEKAMSQVRREPIRADGAQTVLAAGINLALDRLDAHLAELAAVNNNAYVPWLIVISDGDSTEPAAVVQKAAARVQEMLRTRRLKTMCLNMGEGSRSLQAFAENGSVGHLENLKVVDFFEMLSRSVSETSKKVIEHGGPDFFVQE